MKQKANGWPKGTGLDCYVTNSQGTKTFEEAQKVTNPAEAYGWGEELKESCGSIRHVKNMKNAK